MMLPKATLNKILNLNFDLSLNLFRNFTKLRLFILFEKEKT